MKFSFARSKKNSAGFIISLEFLLVMALVVIPVMVGLFLLGRKVVTLYLNYVAAVEQPLSRPVIWDSSSNAGNAKPVGAVIGYDQFSAPLILYRDATPPSANPEFIPGVLLGVRPNRFTTQSRVYYAGPLCGGTEYVMPASSGSNEIGFISLLQGVNYAMGRGNMLYRETAIPSVTGQPFAVRSFWNSQETGDGSVADTTSAPSCTPIPAPSSSILSISGLAGTASGNAPAPNLGLQMGDIVMVSGVTCTVLGVPGQPCAASFDVASVVLSAGGGATFSYPSGGDIGAGNSYDANSGTITLLSTRNLVGATLVSDFDTGILAGTTGNFFLPLRLAFPTVVPGPPLVPGPG